MLSAFCRFDIKLIIFVALNFTISYSAEDSKNPFVADFFVTELYKLYIGLVDNVSTTGSASRRLFKHNKQFEIHVKKLKEVNGYKKHNLAIRENRNGSSPLIYIDNPVESKIPYSFLTLDEFKEALTNRVLQQRKQFATKEPYRYTNKQLNLLDMKISTARLKLKQKIEATEVTKNLNRITKKIKEISIKGKTKGFIERPMKSVAVNSQFYTKKTTTHLDSKTAVDKISTKRHVNETTEAQVVNNTEKYTQNEMFSTEPVSIMISNENLIKTQQNLNNINESTLEINTETNSKLYSSTSTKENNHEESTTNANLEKPIKRENNVEEDIFDTEIQTVTEIEAKNYSDKKPRRSKTTIADFDFSFLNKFSKKPIRTTKKRVRTTKKVTRKTLGRPLVFIGDVEA